MSRKVQLAFDYRAIVPEHSALLWLLFSLFIFLAIFYLPFLSSKLQFYRGDVTWFYEPLCTYIGNSFKCGRLPLWNPLCYCGMPQIAITTPSIFYAPMLLFAFMGFSPALALTLVLHQCIAACGNYLLCLRLGAKPFAAAIAGLIVACSGYMFCLENNFPLVLTAAWLPLLIWALLSIGNQKSESSAEPVSESSSQSESKSPEQSEAESVKKSRTGRGRSDALFIFLTGLLVALLITAGRPEIYGPGILIAGGSAFLPFLQAGAGLRFSCWPAVLIRLLALSAGIMLASPALLPALEWSRLSERMHGLQLEEILLWSSNWYDFLCLGLVQPLGDLNLYPDPFLPLVASRAGWLPILSSAYVGPFTFTLAFWSLLSSRRRLKVTLWLLTLLSVIVAMGKYTPFAQLALQLFPLFSLLRYPVKLLFFVVWCLSLLAASGIDALNSQEGKRSVLIASAVLWLLLLLAGLGLSAQLGTANPELATRARQLAAAAGQLIGQELTKTAALGLLAALAALALRSGKLRQGIFNGFILLGLLSTLLGCAWSCYRHGLDSALFERKSLVAAEIKKLNASAKVERRVMSFYDPAHCTPPPGFARADQPGRGELFVRQIMMPNTNMDAGIPSMFGYECASLGEYVGLTLKCYLQSSHYLPSYRSGRSSDLPLARLAQMSSCGYVLSFIMDPESRFSLRFPRLDGTYFQPYKEFQELNLSIYKVKDPLPRVYFSSNWELKTHAESLKSIIEAEHSAFNPALKTIVEGQIPEHGPLLSPGYRSSCVQVLAETPERMLLAVRAPADGFVVLADQYYPGWQAVLDGKMVEIHRANGVQRAVFAGKGQHQLEFVYRPESFKWALVAVAGGFILLSLLIVAQMRLRRQEEAKLTIG